MSDNKSEKVSDETAGTDPAIPKLEVVVEPPMILPDINVVLGRQQNQYFHTPDWPTDEEQTLPIAWIVRHDGMWQRRINDVGIFVIHVSTFNVPGFPIEENAEHFVLKHGHIPHQLLDDCIAFFQKICDASKDEVYLQIFWGLNPDEPDVKEPHHFIWCPNQVVSGASVHFQRNVDLEKNASLVFEIHSHNTMSAYFSPTDNNDEKSDRLFAVVGRLDTARPEKKFSFVCGGKRVDIPEDQIFTKPLGNPNFAGWLKNITRAGAANSASSSGSSQAYRSEGYWSSNHQPAAPGTWQTQGQGQTQATTPAIRPSHVGATSGPLTATGSRSLFEDEGEWDLHDRRSATVQKRTSAPEEIRAQVDRAAKMAESGFEATLKAHDFMKDVKVVPGFKTDEVKETPKPVEIPSTEKTVEPEVSTSGAFFRRAGANRAAQANTAVVDDSSTESDTALDWIKERELEQHDRALGVKCVEISIRFANQRFIEVEMTDDQKKLMFQELMVHMEPHDIGLLTETIAEMGHEDALKDALNLTDFEDSESADPAASNVE